MCAALFACTAYAQKVFISGKEGNRPLVWSDFSGKADYRSPYDALTYWTATIAPLSLTPENDSVTVFNLPVILRFENAGCWVKPGRQTSAALSHEQDHFNVGILCMRELITLFEGRKLSAKDFNTGLQELFNTTLNKYKDLSSQYDKETNHGLIKAQQLKWHQFFQDKLSGK